MKTKHTLSFWNIDETEDTVFIHADGKTIAQIELSPEVRNADDSSMLREQVHNALLISAAPELLRFAFYVLTVNHGVPGLEGYAHQVISKALGGPTEPSLHRERFVMAALQEFKSLKFDSLKPRSVK